MKQVAIGIDPGVETGIAVWDITNRVFITIESTLIHKAMEKVQSTAEAIGKENTIVYFEDARLRKWYGKSGREKLQGAGSIKRDSKIWEDFLTDKKIGYQQIAPRSIATKMDTPTFNRITKWKQKTNNHARDAAMIVFNL